MFAVVSTSNSDAWEPDSIPLGEVLNDVFYSVFEPTVDTSFQPGIRRNSSIDIVSPMHILILNELHFSCIDVFQVADWEKDSSRIVHSQASFFTALGLFAMRISNIVEEFDFANLVYPTEFRKTVCNCHGHQNWRIDF